MATEYFVLLLFLFSSLTSGQRKIWGQEVSFSSTATSFAIHGRGDTTIVGGIPASEQLKVYNQNEVSQSTSQVTLRQTINSPSSLVDNFGRALALEGDDVTGNLLIVGGNGPNSNKQYNGAVYFYTGDNSQWSFQQTILVKSMMNEAWSMFGLALDLDSATDRRLVIGCSNCTSPSSFLNTGSIYVFEPISSPKVVSWTEQQRLTTNTLYAIGAVDVQIYRDTLLGVGYTYRPPRSLNWMKGVVFRRDLRSGKWSEVQTLMPPQEVISDVDVYDDTMVIGSSNFRYFGTSNAGAVLVYYPNTPLYSAASTSLFASSLPHELDGPPPKTQWSQQQALYSDNAMVNGYYGSTVKLWGNVMAITEPGSGKVYVLERENRAGTWSQQIAISAAVSTSLTVDVQGSDVVVGDGTNAYVYSNNRLFNCLFILLQDQFGDGWGDAKLVVESPVHGLESFAPGCDRENPLAIRFCAIDTLDNGHYKFRIVNHEEAEFHWEILWKVYEERTGEWHIGNWHTEMDFDWSYDEEGFHNTRITRPLTPNITCSRCPTKPTTRRTLKGGTPAPTVSPAPTLAISSTVNWKYLTLQDTADQAWFRRDHSGTSYYISDGKGKHLVAVGTLCSSSTLLPHECWIDLPSGDYILRIGGAADVHKATHLWRFCSMTADLPPQTHLEFFITDDEARCRITSFYTRSHYCDHVANYDVILKMHFYFSQTEDATAAAASAPPSLTSADNDVLKGTLSTLLSPYSLTSVEVGAVSESEIILQLTLHWGTNIFQSEEVFHEQLQQLSEAIDSHLGNSMEKMAVLLRSMSPHDSLLYRIQHIYLTLVEYAGITGGVSERQEVVTFHEKQTQGSSEDEEDLTSVVRTGEGQDTHPLWRAMAAWGGWGLLAGALVLVAAVAAVAVRGLMTRSHLRSSPSDGSSVLSCVSDVEQSYSPVDSSSAAAATEALPLCAVEKRTKKTKKAMAPGSRIGRKRDPLEGDSDEEDAGDESGRVVGGRGRERAASGKGREGKDSRSRSKRRTKREGG